MKRTSNWNESRQSARYWPSLGLKTGDAAADIFAGGGYIVKSLGRGASDRNGDRGQSARSSRPATSSPSKKWQAVAYGSRMWTIGGFAIARYTHGPSGQQLICHAAPDLSMIFTGKANHNII